jgi:hypothetical protein
VLQVALSVSVGGAVPQSDTQLEHVSLASHTPSPQPLPVVPPVLPVLPPVVLDALLPVVELLEPLLEVDAVVVVVVVVLGLQETVRGKQ